MAAVHLAQWRNLPHWPPCKSSWSDPTLFMCGSKSDKGIIFSDATPVWTAMRVKSVGCCHKAQVEALSQQQTSREAAAWWHFISLKSLTSPKDAVSRHLLCPPTASQGVHVWVTPGNAALCMTSRFSNEGKARSEKPETVVSPSVSAVHACVFRFFIFPIPPSQPVTDLGLGLGLGLTPNPSPSSRSVWQWGADVYVCVVSGPVGLFLKAVEHSSSEGLCAFKCLNASSPSFFFLFRGDSHYCCCKAEQHNDLLLGLPPF